MTCSWIENFHFETITLSVSFFGSSKALGKKQ